MGKSKSQSGLYLKGERALGLSWSAWYPLTEEHIKRYAPKDFGIYKVREARGTPVPRLVGKSEILYLGRSGTTANRTLRTRLLELVCYRQHIAGPRVKRVKEELGLALEFCYAKTDDPENVEKILLMSYEKEHYELPPLNNIGGL